jgi:double-stranded uracil-DNA glycosylase
VPHFTRAELESFRGVEVPDLVGTGIRLVFVGINPGLRTAATQIHFGNPANRFRPALVAAGLLAPPADGLPGMTADDLAELVRRGVGITNLVRRATARADELTAGELAEGATRLETFVTTHRPRVVAVLGITAYRTAFRRPRATPGRQPEDLAGVALWVVPNPSGLNAHETVASLATAYAAPARAAGVLPGGGVTTAAPAPSPPRSRRDRARRSDGAPTPPRGSRAGTNAWSPGGTGRAGSGGSRPAPPE